MATTTAGNVLAFKGQPEPLWDTRVAVLQRYISAGQVIGRQPERWLLSLLRMALPEARLPNQRHSQWSAAMPVSQGHTTGVTTCLGRSFALISA